MLDRIDHEIAALKGRKNLLLNKNLQAVISDKDYKEQVEILEANMAIKEIERSECKEEKADIGYFVNLTEALLENISTVWLDAPFEQKLRFQTLLFPKGMYYEDKIIRTPELGLPFALMETFGSKKTTLARPEGLEPPT